MQQLRPINFWDNEFSDAEALRFGFWNLSNPESDAKTFVNGNDPMSEGKSAEGIIRSNDYLAVKFISRSCKQ